jgi:phage replication O-like protein O
MTPANQLKPNFTQIPNVFFDDWLSELSKGEIKILLYIMRRTYGFQKSKDRISLSQIQEGIKGNGDEMLDKGTGLSRATISESITLLEEKGIITVDREKYINTYSMNLEYRTSTKTELVRKLDTDSTKTEPKLVRKLNTQKKGNKVIQKKVYGELQSVKLTEEEYDKLLERFGERNLNILIFELDTYIQSSGKKYQSHYATILNWAKRKWQEQEEKKITKNNNIAFT